MAERNLDLVTIGETLTCFTSLDGRLQSSELVRKSIGGTESNTAIGLARLGRRVAWISRLGDDPLGQEIVYTLRGEGVDVSGVTLTSEPTGLMIKDRRAAQDIHVYYYRRGSAASRLSPADVPNSLLDRARRVHLTGITLALGDGPADTLLKTAEYCQGHGVPLSFDPNYRSKLWSEREASDAFRQILPFVDDLLITGRELRVVTGLADERAAVAAVRRDHGIARVVVRHGPEGAVGYGPDEERVEVAAAPVSAVVDTVGAGDGFNAGYLHTILGDGSFAEALANGAWVASRVIEHRGDYEGLPSRAEFARRDVPSSPTTR